jgi:AraC-like DNA-binding protein
MAIYTSHASAEPDEAVELISAAYVDVTLSLPPDRESFRFALDRFDGGCFQLDRMEIAAHAAFSYEPDQEYFISTVGRGTLGVRQRGADERLVPGEVALIGRPGVETRTEVDAFRQGVVQLRAGSLRAAAGLDPRGDQLPEFSSILPISEGHARTWRRGVAFVTATFREDPAVLESPLVLGGTERMLAGLVLATFPNDAFVLPERGEEHDARSPATLRRAIAFIESNAQADIGIDDIAAAARVSRRAVQQAFRRHHDTTPTAYLRRVRLDAAHRELLDAAPGDGLTVTDVAYRWGFCSPSRFTERYHAAFGTTPSATLRG